jgi:chorismate dehydratase
LQESKRQGIARVAEIAWHEANALGLDPAFCRRYLTNIIRFDLGAAEKAGLDRFHQLAIELGHATPGVTFGYYHQSPTLSAARE